MLSHDEQEYQRRKQIVTLQGSSSLESDQFPENETVDQRSKQNASYRQFQYDFNHSQSRDSQRPDLKGMTEQELRENTEKLRQQLGYFQA